MHRVIWAFAVRICPEDTFLHCLIYMYIYMYIVYLVTFSWKNSPSHLMIERYSLVLTLSCYHVFIVRNN